VGDIASGAADIASGAITGGLGSLVSGIGSIFGGGKGRASEKMQKVQQVQLLFQSLCEAEHAAMQAKMIASGNYNSARAVDSGIRRTLRLLQKTDDIDFSGIFPDSYGILNQDEKIVWEEAQTARQYDASSLSKQMAREASANIQTMPGRAAEIIGAAQSAPGALAVGQANVAATMAQVELTTNLLSTQVAHNQVVESHYDKMVAAEMRAIEYRKRMRRGLPGYEGDGGLGALLAGEE
jgi:hypothetical protein